MNTEDGLSKKQGNPANDSARNQEPKTPDAPLESLETLVRKPESDVSASESSSISLRIGNYKLFQLIGEGGMGAVWMAEQTEPVKRRVALKLIKSGNDSKPIIARFEAERQALALMDHPSIAKILDGGTTESGQPYFVMELVVGIPITEYCDKHRLSLPERLQLFMQVCSAIQHAHQKGIIHRDLKPANILVGVYDGKPVPKIIDFGLAKALDHQSKLTDRTLFTEFGAVVGTLQYMSPEQADLDEIDIDTRADIYAMGVLLYELLTGSTPIEVATLKQLALLKVLETIRDTDPPRPSARLSSSSHHLPVISGNRKIDPSRLQSELRGDLDWIVMKALEKDRSRRYESASGFAADIERYLTDQPVVARPPTATYKLSKFFKKNRAPVITAAAMVLLLIAGMAGTLWGLSEANRQTALAVRNRDLEKAAKEVAEKNLARAIKAEIEIKNKLMELKTVSDFQASQLSEIDVATMAAKMRGRLLDYSKNGMFPNSLAEDELEKVSIELEKRIAHIDFVGIALNTLQESVFEPALSTIHQRYSSFPQFQASMLSTIATTAERLGLSEFAITPASEALEIRNSTLGPNHQETIVAKNNLGVLLRTRGKRDEAEPLLRETLTDARNSIGNTDQNTIRFMNNLGELFREQGKFEEAESLFREGLENLAGHSEDRSEEWLTLTNNLSTLLSETGKLEEADRLMTESLPLIKKAFGDEHPNSLQAINNLATLHLKRGKGRESEKLIREAYVTCLHSLGRDHPVTLSTINQLAGIFMEQRKASEAEPLIREALKSQTRTVGDFHPATLTTMNSLAGVLYSQGKKSELENLLREILTLRRQTLGNLDPATLRSINNLGMFLKEQGKLIEAESLMKEVVDGCRHVFKKPVPFALTATLNLATTLRFQNKQSEAAPLYEEALVGFRNLLGSDNTETLKCVAQVAIFLESQGDIAEAEKHYLESIVGLRKKFQDEHPSVQATLLCYGQFLIERARFNEAIDYLRPVAITGDPSGASNLLKCYCELGKREDLRSSCSELADAFRKKYQGNPQSLASGLVIVGSALNSAGEFSLAEPILSEATELLSIFPDEYWQVAFTRLVLGVAKFGLGRLDEARDMIESSHKRLTSDVDRIPEAVRQSTLDQAESALKSLMGRPNNKDL